MSVDQASFESHLRGRQAELLTVWRELILASFPEQTARFLQRERDPSLNPLGDRIRGGTADLLEGLVRGRPLHDLAGPLDTLVRFRAVQGQPPSQALEFVFLLKRAARQALGGGSDEAVRAAFDDRIDALALCAFDAYTRCREEIHEIRVRDVRRRVASVFERLTGGDEQRCAP